MTIWWASHRSAVPAAGVGGGQVAQPGGGEVVGVALAGRGGGAVGVQQAAVFGDEQDDQPVGDAQQGAVQIPVGVVSGGEVLAQGDVVRAGQESVAEVLQGDSDAVLQGEPGAGSDIDGLDAPALQPAVLQPCGRQVVRVVLAVGALLVDGGGLFRGGGAGEAGGEAAGVGGEEQQSEVGVELVGEDLVEVELDVGLTRQGRGVAQQAQLAAVGQRSPTGFGVRG